MGSVLLIGLLWAAQSLDLAERDLSTSAFAMLALVAVPAAVAHNAWSMVELGRAFAVNITVRTALRTAAWSQVVELLPVPGGAVVRTSLLVQNGVRLGRSAELVMLLALMWTSFGLLGAGISLRGYSVAGEGLIATGAAAIFLLTLAIWKRFNTRTATRALTLRLLGMGIVAFRMKYAFATIGIALPISSAFGFAAATIAGNSASIAPGGLGLSEGIAALLATQIEVSAAAAFLAVALSRLVGLALNILIAVALPGPSAGEVMHSRLGGVSKDRQ
ncbi:MAG: hypothetical protein ACO1OX_07055 [Novosphingobium sp.]